jgi:5-methylcytosine-specific restriction endonuclease McrA
MAKGQKAWNKGNKNGFIDLTGLKFGRWIVIKPTGRQSKNGQYYWLCKCDCGKEKEVIGQSLKTGMSKSCGCLHKDFIKTRILPNNLAIKQRIYNYYKKKAKERNIEFYLDFDLFVSLIENVCHYCGKKGYNKMSSHASSSNYLSCGIDRKNSNENYTNENCVSCCRDCNRAKGIMGYSEFIEWINNLYNRLIKNNG